MNWKIAGALLTLLGTPAFAQKEQDLVVGNRTLVQRAAIKGHGSRMIAVGQPGGFNFAFDALHCAPVVAWFGEFLDMTGETNGRGGSGCKILGIPVSLGIAPPPFRTESPEKLPASVIFRGYRRDAQTGLPTFCFEVDGVKVEQRLTSPAPDTVRMDLVFPTALSQRAFYLLDPAAHTRVAWSEPVHWSTPGILEIPPGTASTSVTLHLKTPTKAFVRKTEEPSGAELFQTLCSACHSLDGSRLIGPTFKGLWGREETVTRNGKTETVKVGAEYIRESILEPQAAVVQGYEAVPMAGFAGILSNQQIEGIIGFLKTLE